MLHAILRAIAELTALAGFGLAVTVWAALYIDLVRI